MKNYHHLQNWQTKYELPIAREVQLGNNRDH